MFHTYMSPGTYEVKVNVTDGSLYSIFITSLKVVELAAPEVRFPSSGAKLSGTILVRGSMQPPSGWTVNVIEVSIDGKAWEEAEGTDSWEYELSTARLSKGQHTMLVRGTVKGGSTEVTSEMSMAFIVVAPEDGGTSILPILIGIVVVVLVLVGLYFLVFRGRGKKDRMEDLWGPPPIEGQTPPVMQPQFRPPIPPGVAPPATEAPRPPVMAGVQPIKEAPVAPQQKKVKVKCPACGKLFTEQDSGERPLHTVCKHCGAKGSIDALPWDETKATVEAPERASEGPEPIPIICPSCGELFELKGPAKEAKCPACGAVGELDPETLEKLKEAKDRVKELTLKCPKCSGMFHVREGGQEVICPYCGARGKLPR
jgi:DNA-directed RNA polymerase subunit RPC12/RpoP